MAICEMCGKEPRFGHNVSFSKKRTDRMWRPNIQTTTIMVKGRPEKIRVCTRCLRTLNKS